MYAGLYGGKGSVWGWLLFTTNHALPDLMGGDASWIKQAQPAAKYYPLGFTNDLTTQGSLYLRPSNATTRVIDLPNGIVSFVGGNLSAPFANFVVLTSKSVVVNQSTNKLTMSIGLANGTFSGTVGVPDKDEHQLQRGGFAGREYRLGLFPGHQPERAGLAGALGMQTDLWRNG